MGVEIAMIFVANGNFGQYKSFGSIDEGWDFFEKFKYQRTPGTEFATAWPHDYGRYFIGAERSQEQWDYIQNVSSIGSKVTGLSICMQDFDAK